MLEIIKNTVLLIFVVSALLILYSLVQIIRGRTHWTYKFLIPLSTVILLYCTFVYLPPFLDSSFNNFTDKQYSEVPTLLEETAILHEQLWIADMHSDSLLWKRDLNLEYDYGHMDIPRLIKGNVALQAFTIVSGVPTEMNFESNHEPQNLFQDMISLLAFLSGWGMEAILSQKARAVIQAQKLQEFSKNSGGKLWHLTNRDQLLEYIGVRENHRNITAGILGIEGLHCLEGDINNIDLFYSLGVRMMAPTHFFDNALGGSSAGVNKIGLTEFGKSVIRKMEKKGILVDIAHASEATIDDVLEMATLPVISSHTGLYSLCPSQRNIKDHHLLGIAKTGGFVSIAFFRPSICGNNDLQSIIDHVKYVRDIVGIDHVALGSDYDGYVKVPFDTTGLYHITNGLLLAGFTKEEIRKVMGENARRVWLQILK